MDTVTEKRPLYHLNVITLPDRVFVFANRDPRALLIGIAYADVETWTQASAALDALLRTSWAAHPTDTYGVSIAWVASVGRWHVEVRRYGAWRLPR